MASTADIFYDMHCHLGFMDDLSAAARAMAAAPQDARIAGALSCSVTPQDYLAVRDECAGIAWAHLAAGLHPWWIADGSASPEDFDAALNLIAQTPFVGEVGLDFAGRRRDSADTQVDFLRAVLREATGQGGKLISVHAVNAAGTVLNLMEETGAAADNDIIFHWFSGSSDDLMRAIKAGCFFSVGERMLASRRGAEYAKAIPVDRLLTETDAPARPGEPLAADAWTGMIAKTLDGLAAVRGAERDALASCVARTSAALLDRR